MSRLNATKGRSSNRAMRIERLAFVLILATGAPACVVHAHPGPTYAEGEEQPGEAEAAADPPAPQAETYGAAPTANHVWIGGHWARRGHNWVWVAGHWHHNPHKKVWVHGRWR